MARRVFGLVNRFLDKEEEDTPSNKFNSNDLISLNLKKDVKDSHFNAIKDYNLVIKNGLSKKTAKLCKDHNLELRKKFDMDSALYLISTIFIVNSNNVLNACKILKIIKGQTSLLPSIYVLLIGLYEKGFLRLTPQDGDIGFKMSPKAHAAFLGVDDVEDHKLSLKEVIREIDTVANLYNNQKPFCDFGESLILKLLRDNKHYDYCKILLDLYDECQGDYESICNDQYQFAFYCLGHYALTGNSIRKDDEVLELFVSWGSNRENLMNTIFNGDNNYLFKNKILERGIDEGGKADKNTLEIHADFKRKYLQGIIKERKHDDIIVSNKITEKTLYFNKDNQNSYDEFISMLMPYNFSKIKERLKETGTRSGFASIFYGEPGTGKTESCYQIAKITGRDIIKVDMSSMRSKWWGEDEKNVKAIFTNYKSILQDSKLEPILLLNEADAIIGKRLDVTGTNGAILTSINATQNIILDELETFEGILIATTNLTQNMDGAFERRFLHKIKFEKPSKENKAKIWQSLLNISEEDALQLASKYDFSGGNIENISRKQIVNNILYGKEYNIETLIKFCDDEKLFNSSRPIGFGS